MTKNIIMMWIKEKITLIVKLLRMIWWLIMNHQEMAERIKKLIEVEVGKMLWVLMHLARLCCK